MKDAAIMKYGDKVKGLYVCGILNHVFSYKNSSSVDITNNYAHTDTHALVTTSI